MALYKVQGPNGKFHEFKGPEGLSQNFVNSMAQDYFEAPAPVAAPVEPKGATGFIPSVMRGGRGISSLLGDVAPAMIGKAFGADEYAKKQMQEAAAYQKETEKLYPAEVASYKDIDSVGKALTYIKESIGEAIPSILPSIFTGGAAAMIGRPAIVAAEKAAQDFAAKEVARAAAKNILTQESIEGIKKAALDVGMKEAQKIALKYQASGALAGSAAQNIPDVYQNIYEATGKEDLGAALAFGSFNAALDAITPIALLRKMSKAGIRPEEVAAAWYKRAGKGAAQGFVTEGGTEALQEVSSAAAEKFVDRNQQFFSEKNFERFINAGLKGGFGGAGITATTDVLFGKGPEAPITQTGEDQTQQEQQVEPPPPPPGTKTTPAFTGDEELKIHPEGFNPPQPPAAPAGAATSLPSTPDIDKMQAEYDTRSAQIDEMKAKGQPESFIQNRINKNIKLKARLDAARTALAQAPTTGEENVGQSIDQAGGEGAGISGAASANAPAGGIGDAKSARVVRPGENVAGANLGEITQPAPVNLSPELQAAQDLLTAIDAGGVPLNPAKINQIARNIGLEVSKSAKPEETISRLREAVSRGSQTAPAAPAGPQVKSVQQDLDELNSLFGDDGLPSKGTARRTKAQIAEDKDRDAILNEIGQNYGLTRKKDETQREYYARIKDAGKYEIKRQAEATEGMPDTQIPETETAKQELKKPTPYKNSITDEQRQMYDDMVEEYNGAIETARKEAEEALKNKDKLTSTEAIKSNLEKAQANSVDQELPIFDNLTDDEVRKYFGEHIVRNSYDEHLKAAQALSDYMSDKRFESRAAGKDTQTKEQNDADKAAAVAEVVAQDNYMSVRDSYGRKTGLSYRFPAWNALSQASKNLYQAINDVNSAMEQDMAFRAIKKQIQRELLDKQTEENIKEAKQQSYREMLVAAERARKGQPAGKGVLLPDNILKKLLSGDIAGVLKYLNEDGKGVKAQTKFGNMFSRQIFRLLAGALQNIEDFKVNVVYDANMIYDDLGTYDANSNTFYFGPNGMDEATVLHELTHAATVKLIHQYYTDKSKLDARTVKAVEHLINVANLAKAELGSKYKNAFENIYEFIAYAMTDLDFQYDLAQIQVESAATVTGQVKRTPYSQREQRQVSITGYDTMLDNLWNYFTGTLAYMYRLFYPRQQKQAILMPTELTGRPRGTKKEAVSEAENIKALDKINRKLRKKGDLNEQEAEESTTGLKPGDVVPVNEDTAARSPDEASDEFKAAFDQEKEEGRDELAPIYGDLVDKGGVTNLKREILREPGFKGNLLLEAADVIQQLFAAPVGGIEQLGGKGGFGSVLQSKGAAKTTKQATTPPAQTDAQITQKALGNVSIKDRSAKSLLRNIFSKAGFDTAVEYFQNDRHPLKMLFDRARMFGVVDVIGKKANDVYVEVSRSIGMATDIYARQMKPFADDVNSAVEAYAKKLNIPVKDALSRLHLILQARHEPERRHIKFLLNVPLDDTPSNKRFQLGNDYYSASGLRQAVLDILAEPAPGLSDKQREVRAQKLREILEKVVADPSARQKINAKGEITKDVYFNEQSEIYNVIAGRSPQEMQAFRNTLDIRADKAEIDAVSGALRKVHKQTIALNKEANYWSEPVANIVDFYGFNDYVPFKGRPNQRTIDEEFNFETRRIGGDYQDAQDRFEGRESESENPILQSLADGATASLRAGRKDTPQTIVNAIKAKIIQGQLVETIKFADRYAGRTTKNDITGPNKIFLYKPDGTIEVWRVNETKIAQAIKRSYRTSNPIWDRADMITSGIGQTHTRYNPAFAPMNFVRDAFTNAGIIGAEFDPITGGKLLTGMASDVANNGLARALNYSKLYANGKFKEIEKLAGVGKPYESLSSKERYYRDLMDYVQMGGRVSYLQGVAAKGALDQLIKEVGRSGILKTKDQIDKFIDIYNDMFELSSRVAAYRLLKDQYYHENLANKMSVADAREDARIRAVTYAKNLANFEQVGKWGKQAGALFMFFRPAATGAVRAIQALSPAFSFNEENFRKEAIAEGRTPQQIERAVAIMQKRQYAARRMMATMTGIGVSLYMMALMMAGDDEEGRNRVVTDDMARWTRYARFFIPGFEKPLQISWGFGPGAFAAAGAQIASIGSGRVSIGEALSNIVTVGLDSFLPLPFSRISPIENFPAWAMDSVTPSAFRPFFEYVMNMDGLGREIYNNRQTRYGDAYTGGDSIPEAYKLAARTLFNATDGAIDWSPNTMYFFASNYFDGMAKMGTAATNLSYSVAGNKDFDPKHDLPFVGSFIGTKSNIDAREFSKVEDQIKAIDKRINSLKDKPEMLDRYLEANPNAYAAVEFYNAQVNGQLRQVRAVANQVRANGELTPRERKLQLEEINGISSTIKRQLLNVFEELDLKP